MWLRYTNCIYKGLGKRYENIEGNIELGKHNEVKLKLDGLDELL